MEEEGKLCIVVQGHGWVVVGYIIDDGHKARYRRGAVIEKWGTTEGVGQLAWEGPLKDTRLRAEGPGEWPLHGSEVRRLEILPRAVPAWKEALEKLWAKFDLE